MDEPDNEAQLVARARRGDGEAWEVLYRTSYPRLHAYVRRRLGDDAARDLVSEAMARAVAGIDRFDAAEGRFEAWLFGICRNVVLQAARRARRGEPPALGDAVARTDAGDALDTDEEAAAMRTAYARLTDEEREVLDLRVIGALSAEEVGFILGRKPGAVRMAQSRALGRLRVFFEEVYR